MMVLVLLAPRGGSPPPAVLLLIPVIFLALSWLTNRLMGIPALYEAFPADPAVSAPWITAHPSI